jgi:hypothetical protein
VRESLQAVGLLGLIQPGVNNRAMRRAETGIRIESRIMSIAS